MRAIVWLVLPWMGIAQVPAPENAPLVTGVLLECDARPVGELSIRAADNRVLRYHFDADLSTTVATRLELKIAYLYDYKNRPPLPTIKKGDSALFAALVFKF